MAGCWSRTTLCWPAGWWVEWPCREQYATGLFLLVYWRAVYEQTNSQLLLTCLIVAVSLCILVLYVVLKARGFLNTARRTTSPSASANAAQIPDLFAVPAAFSPPPWLSFWRCPRTASVEPSWSRSAPRHCLTWPLLHCWLRRRGSCSSLR